MTDNVCNCCGSKGETNVVSSALGPFSFAACFLCLQDNVEPRFAFEAIYEMIGESVAPHVKQMKTYVSQTEVLTYEEFVEYKKANPDE